MTFGEFSRQVLQRSAAEKHLSNWVVLRRIDSSNSLARRIVETTTEAGDRPVAAAVVAWEQTAGRGRGEHQWVSAPGMGVYTSLLLPQVPRSRLACLPLLAAVVVARTVRRHLDPADQKKVGLRWPNDVLIGERKIAGILIEAATLADRDPTVIVGYGVNHGHEKSDLPVPGSTSMRLSTDRPPGLPSFVVELASAIAGELASPAEPARAAEAFSDLMIHRPGDRLRCRTAETVLEGTFVGLDDSGFLRLRVGDREETVSAGEILDRPPPGRPHAGAPAEDESHAYFRSIEDVFIRLRGAPFLLSPEDWRVASAWRRDGIPLDTVGGVLERIYRDRAETGRRRSISGLRYFDRAVRSDWARRRSLVEPDGARDAQPFDPAERLKALARAVSEVKPAGPELERRILTLAGSTEEIEASLARLDREMLSTAHESLDDKERGRLEALVEAGLRRAQKRLAPDQAAEARVRLERQALRRLRGLPILSLFSPAAD